MSMPTNAALTSIALGILLTAAGLAFFWKNSRTPQATWAVTWTAGGILAVTAALLWLAGDDLGMRIIAMAAIAAPLPTRYRHEPAPRRGIPIMLPALALTAYNLPRALDPGRGGALYPPPSLTGALTALGGGMAARALGEALSRLLEPQIPGSWLPDVLALLITICGSSIALINLWRYGSAWGTLPNASGWTAVWIVWAAVWLGKRARPRINAALTALAAAAWIAMAAR